MKAVKEKEQLQKTVDSWKDSSKNLWRLINSGMSSNDKLGLGFEIQSNDEVLSYEEEMNFSVFKCSKEDSMGKPSYSRFTKTNDYKGVPHPLSGDYTPKPPEEIDDSFEGSCGSTSEHSFETESESLNEPNELSKSRLEVTNEKDVSASKSKEVEPSCVSHIKSPRQPLKDKETHKVIRRELEEIALKHLGKVPENNTTSTNSVNTGSQTVNTGRLDHDDSLMPELEIFHKPETGIFDEASYDEEGVITDFNSLLTEIEVSTTPALRIHNIHSKSQILGDPKSAVQTRSKVQHKSGAHALFRFIQKQQRNNHKDQQH
ncbi:hypothetical protein Tco_0050729, partial [Tanacetum coccineum]